MVLILILITPERNIQYIEESIVLFQNAICVISFLIYVQGHYYDGVETGESHLSFAYCSLFFSKAQGVEADV